jgi:hypothetical protein
MGLPTPPNTTCDIYRAGHAPPAAPDVAGVAVNLSGAFADAHRAAVSGMQSPSGNFPILRWTHVMLVDVGVDIRDNYQGPVTTDQFAGYEQPYAFGDTVYVPDKSGTIFYVVFVERLGYGSGFDHKRVYLQRGLPAWPTNNL